MSYLGLNISIGMATGIVVACNGFGGFVAALSYRSLIGNFGVSSAFIVMGVVYGGMILGGGMYVCSPPSDWAVQMADVQLPSTTGSGNVGGKKANTTTRNTTVKGRI